MTNKELANLVASLAVTVSDNMAKTEELRQLLIGQSEVSQKANTRKKVSRNELQATVNAAISSPKQNAALLKADAIADDRYRKTVISLIKNDGLRNEWFTGEKAKYLLTGRGVTDLRQFLTGQQIGGMNASISQVHGELTPASRKAYYAEVIRLAKGCGWVIPK